MHARRYYHRDIKPGNLFWTKSSWKVGDFGLIDYPDKESLTREGQKLGPLHYLAPEMLLNAATAQGGPADVYALAKVLWTLVAGQRFPMQGQLDRNIAITRLSSWVGGTKAFKIEPLLHAATHPDPGERPTMRDLYNELKASTQMPVSQAPAPVDLPSGLAAQLTERSGQRERLEQRQAHAEDQRIVDRINAWRRMRFDSVMEELHQKILAVEGMQAHRQCHRNEGPLTPLVEAPSEMQSRVPPTVFEDVVTGSIRRSSGTYVDFAFGVRLSLESKEVRYSDGSLVIPVDTKPVVVIAVYLYGHSGRRKMTPIWSDESRFLISGG